MAAASPEMVRESTTSGRSNSAACFPNFNPLNVRARGGRWRVFVCFGCGKTHWLCRDDSKSYWARPGTRPFELE
jgi:hypothetical protein